MRLGPRVDSKKFDIIVATTIPRSDPAVRNLCARLKSAIEAAGKNACLPYPQLIGQITRQEMRMVRD
jgi:hypothetical protein